MAFSIHDSDDETPSTVSVSEITTRHLRRLKQSASDFLGKTVNAAVISVPTNFGDAQREALIAAAKNADIEVLQLIDEPAAALLAYDARPEAAASVVKDKLVVVADFGGIRSDVAVVASRGGIYTVLATVHDYELGGANLDQVVIDYFAKEFIKKHKVDPREDVRGLAKLKLECEATKKALSIGTNATLSIESLTNGIDYGSNINRTRYELLAGKVFAQFTGLIESAVKKAELDPLDIDEVCILLYIVYIMFILIYTGHPGRRHLAHPQDRPPRAGPVPRNHTGVRARQPAVSHQPVRAVGARRGIPSLADPGV